ncbi:MAG: hypothetical protein GY822_09465 [Deltaproteobacteria bacterium]|nr:hypothetical protein [Deltaproteobacteria bacterium]
MAGIQNQNAGVRRFPWASPAGAPIGPAGVTKEELQISQVRGKGGPEVRPIAQKGPVEFISPSGGSDNLRLAVPDAANKFATPVGPRHDHMMVRTALGRSRSDVSRALIETLKGDAPAGVNPEATKWMRASLSSEHKMNVVLQDLQEMQDHIYGFIAGNQSA